MTKRILAQLTVAACLAVPALAWAQADNAAAPAPPIVAETKGSDVDPNQRMRCRIVNVTGSMVKGGRVCRTVAEWRAIIDNNNENARKMVQDGTTRSVSN